MVAGVSDRKVGIERIVGMWGLEGTAVEQYSYQFPVVVEAPELSAHARRACG